MRLRRLGLEPASGGGGGEGPPEQVGATHTRLVLDSSDSGLRQQPRRSGRLQARMEPGGEGGNSSSEVETHTRSSAREATADSSASPSAPVPSTQDVGKTKTKTKTKGKGKRKRSVTTSSPPPDESPPKLPMLSTGEDSEAAVEKSNGSSRYSSPLRRPMSLLVYKTTRSGNMELDDDESDEEVLSAFTHDVEKYRKKLARVEQLPTLKKCKVPRNITDWHDLKQRSAVLDVARSVLSLSSSDGDKEINQCSGIIIEWIEADRIGIIVTSSQIICTKISLVDLEDNNVYAPDAKDLDSYGSAMVGKRPKKSGGSYSDLVRLLCDVGPSGFRISSVN